ncbi:MAG: hypothetical protein ACRD1V_09490, partial [Vicinamibacterales bacterium]
VQTGPHGGAPALARIAQRSRPKGCSYAAAAPAACGRGLTTTASGTCQPGRVLNARAWRVKTGA